MSLTGGDRLLRRSGVRQTVVSAAASARRETSARGSSTRSSPARWSAVTRLVECVVGCAEPRRPRPRRSRTARRSWASSAASRDRVRRRGRTGPSPSEVLHTSGCRGAAPMVRGRAGRRVQRSVSGPRRELPCVRCGIRSRQRTGPPGRRRGRRVRPRCGPPDGGDCGVGATAHAAVHPARASAPGRWCLRRVEPMPGVACSGCGSESSAEAGRRSAATACAPEAVRRDGSPSARSSPAAAARSAGSAGRSRTTGS